MRESTQRHLNHQYRRPTAYRIVEGLRDGALYLLIASSLLLVNSTQADGTSRELDTQAVLKVVTTIFDGMRDKDETLLRDQFSDEAVVGKRPAEFFISSVIKAEAYLDERTFDETVLIDEDLATAWTPYKIFVDGKFRHCGVNVFIMRRVAEQWKVRFLDDSRRTHDCDAS